MKTALSALAIIALCVSRDTQATEFQREIPRAGWEPIFFGAINELTRRAGWEPLRERPLRADTLEVRIWIGFGVVPLEAFVLRRDDGKWTARHLVDTVQKPSPAKVRTATPKSGWDSLWKRLTELRLLTLPDSSALPREEEMIVDGESYVVEINQDSHYRTYEYSNPQFRDLPEAKNIVEIIHVLHRELGSP